MTSLKNKKAVVMGLKRSGASAVRLLLREGAEVVGTDADRNLKVDLAPFEKLPVTFKLGRHDENDFMVADLVVVSPGIPTDNPLLAKVRRRGIPVIGELELGASFLDPRVTYAITGTNGKSTTTVLLGEILKEGGKRTFVGGNLGVPASEAALFPPSGGWEAVVLEVSSFQLETIRSFHPGMAAILNITPDHGERYADLNDYSKAKFEIFRNQVAVDYAFLNWDDLLIRNYPNGIESKIIWFSLKEPLKEGISLDNGVLYYRQDERQFKICEVESAALKGSHNIENIAVASGMAFLAGVSPEIIQNAVHQFQGLAHRMEKVRVLRGVTYINDSKATNVGAVVRSLENVEPPILLIAGGKEKGGGFSALIALVKEKVKALFLIGEAKERLRIDLNGATQINEAATLEEAVQKAFRASQSGDTVLFSPACSSYDMFKDYADRGERFRKAVKELP
jgi:UDP-N-acetylmuramoylalanine--D-glutamate ligase